jgi:tetratricopeptide (TPR) repeat protein
VRHLERAGDNALRRSAHEEAIRHLTRALTRLEDLAETPERAASELRLHLALGPAWMAAKGYAAPEVGATYRRALDISRQLDAPVERARAMKGLWNFHLVRSELETARRISEDLLTRAADTGDPALARRAHAELGQTDFHRGELSSARAHLAKALSGAPRTLASLRTTRGCSGSRAIPIRPRCRATRRWESPAPAAIPTTLAELDAGQGIDHAEARRRLLR